MTNQLNGINVSAAAAVTPDQVVVKNLSELPKSERRMITTELMRIHNLVNSAENDLRKMGGKDKADSFRIDK
jgi:hypothetical protein